MLRAIGFLITLLLCSWQPVCAQPIDAQKLSEMRHIFLQAEQYIIQGRDADYLSLSDNLKSYPLYPYLHAQWLKNHLDDNDSVQNFVNQYPQSRYAQIVWQKWLQQLGQRQQWLVFLQQYRAVNDTELQCYNALAQYYTGDKDNAINTAKQLWQSGKSQPAACDGLFAVLKTSADFNEDLVWKRFQAALYADNADLAGRLVSLLPKAKQADAQLWLNLHKQPAQVAAAAPWKHEYAQAGQLFAHAIKRWLDDDPSAALQTWDKEKADYALAAEIVSNVERQLALALALRHDSRAYLRLSQLPEPDNSIREWRVRSALYDQNWKQVTDALQSLNEDEKHTDKWQYWQARALAANGEVDKANELYKAIAKNRSYYGFLAADKLQLAINLEDHPLQVPQAEIDYMQQQNEFMVASELLALDRKQEAKKQWWHAFARLDQHGMTVAAKLAQQWHLPSVAIFSIAKANAWDDIDLRFPLLYLPWIQTDANAQQLDAAIIFGLIRQESAFDEQAESPVGAKGLMQIMPKTAEQIALDTKTEWKDETALFNPEINIKFGSFYYKKLLKQFHGRHPLAAAAYNAGSNRVKRWLPGKGSVPGDIWIEAIPYKETRAYVSSVLQYALIYQQRLQASTLKIGELIASVGTVTD